MKGLYDVNIKIKGKHAEYMKKLANPFISSINRGFFNSNLEVYLIAPIIGKVYGRKADVDNSKKDVVTTIHTEQLNKEMDRLEYNYRMLMIIEEKNSVDIETRANRAFRYDRNVEKRQYGDLIFNSYVLGGIEVLYEKLFTDAEDAEDYILNLHSFTSDFNERYYNITSNEDIYNMCNQSSM